MNKNDGFFSARRITALAVLLALIIVLQVFASGIKIGVVTFTFTMIPIVIGAIVLGPLSGALLGFIFGIITLLMGITGADAFTNILFSNHPFLTSLICLVKGTAAGAVSGLVFKALKNKKTASFIAAGIAPLVNTSLFIIGALFMSGTLTENFLGNGQTVLYFLIIDCAGINFLVEFALNIIFAPSISKIYQVVKNKFNFNKSGETD